MNKICGIYKITNTITGDFYIGSSKNVKLRWLQHKRLYTWKQCPNNPMYHDMQKYGVDYFDFEILEEVEIGQLKEKEQQFIEKMHPTYNNINAKGLDVERYKEYQKEYQKSDRCKESVKRRECQREYQKKYQKSDKYKKYQKEYYNKYNNQLCCFNGETLTLNALSARFSKSGIEHPVKEAKKYLVL